jgi:hypothetical protein
MVALADFPLLVTVMMTVDFAAIVPGAVYSPFAEIVPIVALPPAMVFTVQVN